MNTKFKPVRLTVLFTMAADNVIETHEHKGDFKIWQEVAQPIAYLT